MELDACVTQEFKEFWCAALTVDGHLTTFSCQHNHHTPQAAEKCIDKIVAGAQSFVWHPEFTERVIDTTLWCQDDPRPLIEWAVPGRSCRLRITAEIA